ncbi:MAG TPA: hypothetical protein VL943_15215 [Niabella sp.]|nr:hypothetical protein [Niabella sp.]
MNRILLVFSGWIIITGLWGCSKKDARIKDEQLSFDRIESVGHLPGFGDNDGLPEGRPFELPKGLHLVNRPNYPFNPDISKLKGIINTFYVDVHIATDSTWGGGAFVFPEGLVVLNTAPSRIQNGMLLGREPVTAPPYNPSTGGDTITVYLGVACMNAGKGMPWADNFGTDDRYYPVSKGTHKPYVISTNSEILKFLSILEDKPHLKLTRHYNPWERMSEDYQEPEWLKPYSEIQDKFWKLTDGTGLNQDDLRELLKAIQPK